ncbi:hypothetical protein [Metamycoplasma orale]|uniref:Lipoprotein n=1 Tax=Metamycoplasma orale TaxID=2121 RepID=A0A448ZWY6_METOS|nr:hypothetical protein [Metamycoplasma orale]VEU55772.1 Uncharacterised protein [Metamycoplasma orale]
MKKMNKILAFPLLVTPALLASCVLPNSCWYRQNERTKKEIKNTFLKIAKTLGNKDFIFPLEIQQGHWFVQNNNTYKQNKDKIKGFKLIWYSKERALEYLKDNHNSSFLYPLFDLQDRNLFVEIPNSVLSLYKINNDVNITLNDLNSWDRSFRLWNEGRYIHPKLDFIGETSNILCHRLNWEFLPKTPILEEKVFRLKLKSDLNLTIKNSQIVSCDVEIRMSLSGRSSEDAYLSLPLRLQI